MRRAADMQAEKFRNEWLKTNSHFSMALLQDVWRLTRNKYFTKSLRSCVPGTTLPERSRSRVLFAGQFPLYFVLLSTMQMSIPNVRLLFPGQRAKYFAEGQDKKEKEATISRSCWPRIAAITKNVMERIKF